MSGGSRYSARRLLSGAVSLVILVVAFELHFGGLAAGQGNGCGYAAAPPTANAGGPYTVTRGRSVMLDGSRSSSNGCPITSYRWTFAPGAGCPSGVHLSPGATKTGERPTVVLLCSVKVTLTVSTSSGENRATANATVTSRTLEEANLDPIPFSQDHSGTVNAPFMDGAFAFGYNRDTKAWDSHHDPDLKDFWLEGIELRRLKPDAIKTHQVHDSNGPFNDFLYVDGHTLAVDRTTIINSKLLPNGAAWDENPGKYRKRLATLVESVRDHERTHGELADAELQKAQDGILHKLEGAIGSDETALLSDAFDIVNELEMRLAAASSEANVHAALAHKWGHKSVTILVEGSNGLPHPRSFGLATTGD